MVLDTLIRSDTQAVQWEIAAIVRARSRSHTRLRGSPVTRDDGSTAVAEPRAISAATGLAVVCITNLGLLGIVRDPVWITLFAWFLERIDGVEPDDAD